MNPIVAPIQGFPTGGAGGVAFQDEGAAVVTATTVNFAGAGVTVTDVAGVATVTIPGGGSSFDPAALALLYDEFYAASSTSGQIGALGWVTANVGGSVSTAITGEQEHPGIVTILTSSGTTDRAGFRLDPAHILSGNDALVLEASIRLPTLSDGTDEYDFFFGLFNSTAPAAATNAVFFQYDRNTSVNWLRGTTSGGFATLTASGTAVGTGWTRLRIEINEAWSNVEYFVNGASVGSNTTNIPTGVGLGPHFSILKSAGTNSRQARVDYFFHTIAVSR